MAITAKYADQRLPTAPCRRLGSAMPQGEFTIFNQKTFDGWTTLSLDFPVSLSHFWGELGRFAETLCITNMVLCWTSSWLPMASTSRMPSWKSVCRGLSLPKWCPAAVEHLGLHPLVHQHRGLSKPTSSAGQPCPVVPLHMPSKWHCLTPAAHMPYHHTSSGHPWCGKLRPPQ